MDSQHMSPALEAFRTPYLLAMSLGGVAMAEAADLLATYDQARCNEVLELAAMALEGIHREVYDDAGQRVAEGVLRAVTHLRGMTKPVEES